MILPCFLKIDMALGQISRVLIEIRDEKHMTQAGLFEIITRVSSAVGSSLQICDEGMNERQV